MPAGHSPTGAPAASEDATRAICELVTNGSIEVSATPAGKIAGEARLLPFGTSVYVPSPAKKPLDANIEIIAALHAAGMEAVPHVAARKIASREELEIYLSRVSNDFGVHRVLVVGGDEKQAAGPYADSLSLLKDDVLTDCGIHEIGVAGYPEGHPGIPPDTLRADLEAKLEMAAKRQLGIEIITQFSFTPTRIIEYCSALSNLAPEIPVYAGLAGPTSKANLIRYANYCGVSTSVRALSDMGLEAVKLARHTDPDEQLSALAHYCALRDTCNVIGIHVFSFGGLERSAQWMKYHCRESTNELA